jgi:hypothetical protein
MTIDKTGDKKGESSRKSIYMDNLKRHNLDYNYQLIPIDNRVIILNKGVWGCQIKRRR